MDPEEPTTLATTVQTETFAVGSGRSLSHANESRFAVNDSPVSLHVHVS